MLNLSQRVYLDRYALATLGVPLLDWWRTLPANSNLKETFADNLHPLERTAVVRSLQDLAMQYRNTGNNAASDAAMAMARFIAERFARDEVVVSQVTDEARSSMRQVFFRASSENFARFGFREDPQEGWSLTVTRAEYDSLPRSMQRLASHRAAESLLEALLRNRRVPTYQPAWGWEIIDRVVLNLGEIASPVIRTGQRLAGSTIDITGDFDSVRQIMGGNLNVQMNVRLNYGGWASTFDAVFAIMTVVPVGGFMSPMRHLAVTLAGGMSASVAMAAVEVAPVSESWRAPLRFTAGLVAGIAGGSIANTAVDAIRNRAPLLVARTLDLARAQAALLENAARQATGTGNALALALQRAQLTAELKAVQNHFSNLRALPAAAGLEAKEALHREAVEALATWETRINAPGLSPSQRAALRNSTAYRQARELAASRTRDLDAAYRAVDVSALSSGGPGLAEYRAAWIDNLSEFVEVAYRQLDKVSCVPSVLRQYLGENAEIMLQSMFTSAKQRQGYTLLQARTYLRGQPDFTRTVEVLEMITMAELELRAAAGRFTLLNTQSVGGRLHAIGIESFDSATRRFLIHDPLTGTRYWQTIENLQRRVAPPANGIHQALIID